MPLGLSLREFSTCRCGTPWRGELTQLWSRSAQVWSKSGRVWSRKGENRPQSAQIWSMSGQVWSNCSNLTQMRPTPAKLGRVRSNFAQMHSKPGPNMANVGKIGQSGTENGPSLWQMSAEMWSAIARCWANISANWAQARSFWISEKREEGQSPQRDQSLKDFGHVGGALRVDLGSNLRRIRGANLGQFGDQICAGLGPIWGRCQNWPSSPGIVQVRPKLGQHRPKAAHVPPKLADVTWPRPPRGGSWGPRSDLGPDPWMRAIRGRSGTDPGTKSLEISPQSRRGRPPPQAPRIGWAVGRCNPGAPLGRAAPRPAPRARGARRRGNAPASKQRLSARRMRARHAATETWRAHAATARRCLSVSGGC